MKEQLKMITLAQANYKKCECCGRVKDVYFKLNVFDSSTSSMLVGDFDLCKFCGENIGDILNLETKTESVVQDFKFSL